MIKYQRERMLKEPPKPGDTVVEVVFGERPYIRSRSKTVKRIETFRPAEGASEAQAIARFTDGSYAFWRTLMLIEKG